MSKEPEIVITFDEETGKVEIEANGYAGSTCLSETSWIERALGVSKNSEKKQEFYQNNSVEAKNQVRQRR